MVKASSAPVGAAAPPILFDLNDFKEEKADSPEGAGLPNGHARVPSEGGRSAQVGGGGLPGASSSTPLFPGVDELLVLFKDSCKELVGLRHQIDSRLQNLKEDVVVQNSKHRKTLAELEKGVDGLFDSFARLDSCISSVGQTAAKIGDHLQYLMEFNSCPGDLMELHPYFLMTVVLLKLLLLHKNCVASLETYGTLGAIVKSRTGMRQVGFLTNRHVAVDLDYPNQRMFHPLPPNLGPGVYLGAVERATSFLTDDLWYGIFAGANPETFVRADGAFIPFADDFDISNVTTSVKGVGVIGEVKRIDLQSPINSLIGRQVVKVGRSSGLTTGTVMAYALEYSDEKGICFFTDFLVVGENQQTFDLEGGSGSLIILTAQDGDQPHPIGIIWGGTANCGRLKLKSGHEPENWTSGVDLGRLLDFWNLILLQAMNLFKALTYSVFSEFSHVV